jgi:hypothetical protein
MEGEKTVRVEYIYGVRWGDVQLHVAHVSSALEIPNRGDLVKLPNDSTTYYVHKRRLFHPKNGAPKWQLLVTEDLDS